MKTCTLRRRHFVNFSLAAFAVSCATLCSAQTQSTTSAVRDGGAKAVVSPPARVATLSAAKRSEEESPSKGQNTGIKVHGHWVIEVKNPDGTVTARREFENKIQTAGMVYLASLLAGNNSPGGLSVLLNGAKATFASPISSNPFPFVFADAGPCLPLTIVAGIAGGGPGGPSTGTTCLITPGAGTSGQISYLGYLCTAAQNFSQNPTCSTNLAVSAPSFTSSGASGTSGQVQITGNVIATAAAQGFVNDVETIFSTCDPSTTPSNCLNPGNTQTGSLASAPVTVNVLTMRPLDGNTQTGATAGDPNPVPYSPGQSISVSVTLSFE